MSSRRDARAQRSAATGAQNTVWSSGEAAASTVGESASAQALLEQAPAHVLVEQAPHSQAQDADSSAPITRSSRRIRATAPEVAVADEPLAAEQPVTADEPAFGEEPVVPAAALAWAAATAAAAASLESNEVANVEPVLAPAEPFELLEPEAGEAPAAEPETEVGFEATEPTDEPRIAASGVDEFEAAARLFAFTGETAIVTTEVVVDEAATVADEAAETAAPAADTHTASPRRRARMAGRQLATASFSIGVMGIVGLLTVGMTTPADAVAAVSGTETTSLVAGAGTDVEIDPDDIQAYVTPESIENVALDRDENYSSVSMGEIAAADGITNYSNFFVNDPNAAIQWPFAVGVPITWGFGMRSGRMHEGADFVPGEGADVQAIADGTVRIATNSGGAFGVTVLIDHIIDGQLVSSRYAHMLYGSLKVTAGQHVTVGTILGNTGNTGRSYGAHTHLEILQDGTTPIDPIAWLRAYTGRASLDHW